MGCQGGNVPQRRIGTTGGRFWYQPKRWQPEPSAEGRIDVRLTHLSLLAFLATSAAAAQDRIVPPLGHAELARRVANAVDSLAARGEFSGVVVIARGNEIVLQRTWGMADRERAIPNDAQTAFNVGSINKAFTAIAIRQLAADGKLHLDSTLATYWPEYPNRDAARQVTIRQLLMHRSGIMGDIFSAPAGKRRADLRHNSQFVPLFVTNALEFPPGSEQRYSNAGYVILGELVSRLSGEDYYDYVKRHIYDRAGMANTAHYPVDALPPNTARGYTRPDDGQLRANTDLLPGRGSAAGGGYSTAADLLSFLRALRELRIPGGGPAGLGIAGGAPGINAVVEGELPGGYDLVVLANLDPPAAQRVARLVRAMLGVRERR